MTRPETVVTSIIRNFGRGFRRKANMPIYEYQCVSCGTFEMTQKITETPLRRCPTCKGKVTKLISITSFQLKGTGWYATDYGSKGSGTGKEKRDGASASSSGSKAETTSTGSGDSASSPPKKKEATAA